MSQQGWRIVEDDEIDQRARHLATQAAGKPTDGKATICACGAIVEQDTDIEVAVLAVALVRAASKENGQTDLGKQAQRASEPFGHRGAVDRHHEGTVPHGCKGRNRPARRFLPETGGPRRR